MKGEVLPCHLPYSQKMGFSKKLFINVFKEIFIAKVLIFEFWRKVNYLIVNKENEKEEPFHTKK